MGLRWQCQEAQNPRCKEGSNPTFIMCVAFSFKVCSDVALNSILQQKIDIGMGLVPHSCGLCTSSFTCTLSSCCDTAIPTFFSIFEECFHTCSSVSIP